MTIDIIKWCADNHVRRFGKYWVLDYHIFAYTDEGIVELFEKSLR